MSTTRQYQPGHDLLRNKAHCAAILEYFMGLPADLPREQLPSTQDLMMDGRFGIRPPNRINDLLHGKFDGRCYDFERIASGRGVYRWRLHYPSRPGHPKQRNQTVLKLDAELRHQWARPFSEKRLTEDDWYVRQTGKPRPVAEKSQADGLPLFSRTVRQ